MAEKEKDERIRINRYLSEIGFCSRRQADAYLLAGRIAREEGPLSPGEKIERGTPLFFDGRAIEAEERKVLLLFHKPVGLVCSTVSQRGEANVVDFVNYPIRIYPVGRLDKDSEGLLLLTNEGELMDSILRSRNGHEKEYLVTVDHPLTEDFLKKMSGGVFILNRRTRPCTVKRSGKASFTIILTEGMNRQIRRMCSALGYEVLRLKRLRVMNLTLGDLKAGEYREATKEEMALLRALLG